MPNPEKKFTLIHVIKDFSKLTNYMLCSPIMKRFNIPWQIGYYKAGIALEINLNCCQPTNTVWSVTWKGTTKAMLTGGAVSSQPLQFTATNDSQYSSSVNIFPIPINTIDDTVIIEIDVTIESMTGFGKPEKIRKFGVEAKELSDVVLKVDGQKFYVSKLFLAAQSTYFNSLLMGKFKEGKKRIVELKDIDPDEFQVFLELLYVDKTLTDSNIEDVLKLVEMYDAKNAARLCEQYLMFESTHSNRTKLQLATQYKFKNLKTHCLNNLKCRADIRAVRGLNQLDESAGLGPSIADDLLELSMSMMN